MASFTCLGCGKQLNTPAAWLAHVCAELQREEEEEEKEKEKDK